MLEVEKFIKDNPNTWEEKITQDPYNIKVSRDLGFILLKYNQINSDFSHKICRECRGIILDEQNDYKVVCKPFDKFFNYGEELADDINWKTALITKKIDGSIIKIWYSDRLQQWMCSTNGVIDANNVQVPFPMNGVNTFYDLVIKALENNGRTKYFTKYLDRDLTFIFEVVGPQNRVVVPYNHEDIYYLAAIDNYSYKRSHYIMSFLKTPFVYNFSSLQDVIDKTKDKEFNNFKNEGFVVSDSSGNRIKIKTEDYLRVHKLRGESSPTPKRFLELMRSGDQEEFLSYFPEYREMYNNFVRDYLLKVDQMFKKLDQEFYSIREKANSRKEFAEIAKKTEYPAFLFQMYDNKVKDYVEFLSSMSDDKILKIMGS